MGRSAAARAACATILVGLLAARSQAQRPEEEGRGPPAPLRVAVAGSAPFVIEEDGHLRGMSMDIWRAMVSRDPQLAGAKLLPQPDVPAALKAVAASEADVALGPISITADRAAEVTFTQPYYQSALSILAPATESLWLRLAPFATRAFFAGLFLLLLVLAGVGALLWLCERRQNPEQFPSRPFPGIGSGIWLALVTMTTVGYGDMAPRTRMGRVVAGGWMLVAMLTASSLTASIATALTLSQIQTPGIQSANDLQGRTVAAITASPAAEFARSAGARVLGVSSVREGVKTVHDGNASAVVWDRPVLAYYLREHADAGLTLSDATYDARGYGIAAHHGARALLRALDVAVLRLQESGELDRIAERWLDPP